MYSFQIFYIIYRGTLGACHIRFENPAHPVKYHGVVCSMKDNFGFIERADVVKEIFFHFSEAKIKEDLCLGDDVEFIIQTRNVSYVFIPHVCKVVSQVFIGCYSNIHCAAE